MLDIQADKHYIIQSALDINFSKSLARARTRKPQRTRHPGCRGLCRTAGETHRLRSARSVGREGQTHLRPYCQVLGEVQAQFGFRSLVSGNLGN
jgi:hypothetical protein